MNDMSNQSQSLFSLQSLDLYRNVEEMVSASCLAVLVFDLEPEQEGKMELAGFEGGTNDELLQYAIDRNLCSFEEKERGVWCVRFGGKTRKTKRIECVPTFRFLSMFPTTTSQH